MDIFKRQIFGHAIGLIFRIDRVQTMLNRGIVGARNDARRRQHIGMGFTARNIFLPKTLVEWD